MPPRSRLITAAILLVASIAAAQTRMSLPTPTGPYAVGRVAYALTDPTRPELLSTTAARRKFTVYVWYPADSKVTSIMKPSPYLPGFTNVIPRLSPAALMGLFRPSQFTAIDLLPQTAVFEGAPIAPGKQQFPLLLFSHGWGNPTFLYTAELQDIVSHGYIVAAVEHPYDSAFTAFPDGTVTLFDQARFDDEARKPHGLNVYAKERVEVMGDDNKFALTEILKDATTRSLHAPFYQRVDQTQIGAFGHSIGGLAAARTCQIDPRVKACIDQDSNDFRGSPFIVTPLDQTQKQPFLLFVVASADLWSPAVVNPSDDDLAAQKITRPEYMALIHKNQATETAQLAGIPGGSFRVKLFALPGFIHRSFTDQTLLDFSNGESTTNLHNFRVAQAYTLAFFDKYLKHAANNPLDSPTPIDPQVEVDRFPAH